MQVDEAPNPLQGIVQYIYDKRVHDQFLQSLPDYSGSTDNADVKAIDMSNLVEQITVLRMHHCKTRALASLRPGESNNSSNLVDQHNNDIVPARIMGVR